MSHHKGMDDQAADSRKKVHSSMQDFQNGVACSKYRIFLEEFKAKVEVLVAERNVGKEVSQKKFALISYKPHLTTLKFFIIWKIAGRSGGPRPHRSQLQALYTKVTDEVHTHISKTVNRMQLEMDALIDSVSERISRAQNVVEFCTNSKLRMAGTLVFAFELSHSGWYCCILCSGVMDLASSTF